MTTLCEEKCFCPLVAACRITLDYNTNDIELCSLSPVDFQWCIEQHSDLSW